MRHSRLPPPRSLPADDLDPRAPRVPRMAQPAGVGGEGLEHRRLGGPVAARARRRRLFRPRTGWFRALERGVNQYLCRSIYPWTPGLARIYGLQLDRGLTVAEAEIEVPGLPPGLDGASVLLVTDIHVGPFMAPRSLRRVFERLQSLGPDLILLGGDLATVRLDEFPPYADVFAALRAPLGVFAVLGNHDHYTGAPARLRDMVEGCGIAVLHNRSVILERGDGGVTLAGIDDLNCGQPDLQAALAGARPGVPVILLSHNPDILFEAARRRVDLVLSGHTHGGQIRVPGLPVLVRMSRYRLDEGRYEVNGTQLVVSRGLGVTGLPLRLACPPEAVFLRLHTAPAA